MEHGGSTSQSGSEEGNSEDVKKKSGKEENKSEEEENRESECVAVKDGNCANQMGECDIKCGEEVKDNCNNGEGLDNCEEEEEEEEGGEEESFARRDACVQVLPWFMVGNPFPS